MNIYNHLEERISPSISFRNFLAFGCIMKNGFWSIYEYIYFVKYFFSLFVSMLLYFLNDFLRVVSPLISLGIFIEHITIIVVIYCWCRCLWIMLYLWYLNYCVVTSKDLMHLEENVMMFISTQKSWVFSLEGPKFISLVYCRDFCLIFYFGIDIFYYEICTSWRLVCENVIRELRLWQVGY